MPCRDLFREFYTTHPWHIDIGKDEVNGAGLGENLERFKATGRGLDLKSHAFQHATRSREDQPLVIDYQYPHDRHNVTISQFTS